MCVCCCCYWYQLYTTISTCHDNQMMKKYEKILNSIFEKIRDFEDGENIDNYLIGPEIKNYFRNYSQTIKR